MRLLSLKVSVRNKSQNNLKQFEDKLISSMKEYKTSLDKQHHMIVISLPDLTKIKSYYGNEISELASEIEKDFGLLRDIFRK